MGVESKHFQNIQTLCVSMNAASSTASISIWKERWEWISVNPADLFMCTLSTKDNWQTSRDQKEENNFWKRKVQIIGLVSSSITILPTLTPRRLPTGHPTRPTEYPKISYCHSNFKKKWSECRSRKKNSNKVLIIKIRGPQQELCRIGVLKKKRRQSPFCRTTDLWLVQLKSGILWDISWFELVVGQYLGQLGKYNAFVRNSRFKV